MLQGIAVSLSEVLTVDDLTGDGNMLAPSGTNTLAAEEDIVILEESKLMSPEIAFTINPPEADSKYWLSTWSFLKLLNRHQQLL